MLLEDGRQPTAVAQKVVDVFVMPREQGVFVQVHAAIAPLQQPRPMHIRVVPNAQQVSIIEREFRGFIGTLSDEGQFWVSGGFAGTAVDESEFLALISITPQIGLKMFDGLFKGWLFSVEV